MAEFRSYGASMVGRYHLLIVEKERGLYRLYLSVDGRRYGHCETVEHPGELEEVIEAVCANFNTRLFEVNPVAPFSREEVLANAPHAFDNHAKDV